MRDHSIQSWWWVAKKESIVEQEENQNNVNTEKQEDNWKVENE